MVKRVFLIRHGQGQHNVLFAQNRIREALALKDPEINDAGERQAMELGKQLRECLERREINLELIVSSPMRRTLMTTDTVFGKPAPCPTIVTPLSSEFGDGGCDYGTPRSEISGEFPNHDFSLVTKENWWTEDETQEQLEERVTQFKDFLLSRPESHIAVVSHGRFLTKFLGAEDFCVFWNCDCKEVELESSGDIVRNSSNNIDIRVEEPWEEVSSTHF